VNPATSLPLSLNNVASRNLPIPPHSPPLRPLPRPLHTRNQRHQYPRTAFSSRQSEYRVHRVSLINLNATQGTWFYVGLGNCGEWNKDSDWIVALAESTYAHGSHCNKVSSSHRRARTRRRAARPHACACVVIAFLIFFLMADQIFFNLPLIEGAYFVRGKDRCSYRSRFL
jgi:hypothetical protein